MNAFVLILGIVLAGAVGDYFLKLASLKPEGVRAPEFLIGMFLYVLIAVGFLYAMRQSSLATIGVWYAMLTILAMAALGVVVFKESLTLREGLGVLLALGAVGLMSERV